jgi:ribose/xylose/arabinose/galactoside ABC-type transport system permease subunit
MTDLGKLLIVLGGVVVLIGAALVLGGRLDLPIGRLPGDITVRGKHSVFYFPLATSIIVSVLLTLVFWLIGRFSR